MVCKHLVIFLLAFVKRLNPAVSSLILVAAYTLVIYKVRAYGDVDGNGIGVTYCYGVSVGLDLTALGNDQGLIGKTDLSLNALVVIALAGDGHCGLLAVSLSRACYDAVIAVRQVVAGLECDGTLGRCGQAHYDYLVRQRYKALTGVLCSIGFETCQSHGTVYVKLPVIVGEISDSVKIKHE